MTDDLYRADLARVHHLGYGFHADACAPSILALLEPVRERDGLVLELGCGSGRLTRHLVDAGHRVVATDASPAMLELAREQVAEAEVRSLQLPDDPLPAADAVVSVGHVLNYLPDEDAIECALAAAAGCLRPGGVLALDLQHPSYGTAWRTEEPSGRVEQDWAIIMTRTVPTPDRFVREMTTFLANGDGTWRRDDERHVNVLLDTDRVPGLLAEHGVEATVASSFGGERFPDGLRAIVGHRR